MRLVDQNQIGWQTGLSKVIYTSFDAPGATGTGATGINEQGEIAGSDTTAL